MAIAAVNTNRTKCADNRKCAEVSHTLHVTVFGIYRIRGVWKGICRQTV